MKTQYKSNILMDNIANFLKLKYSKIYLKSEQLFLSNPDLYLSANFV